MARETLGTVRVTLGTGRVRLGAKSARCQKCKGFKEIKKVHERHVPKVQDIFF
jgi:hypothetical protein